MQLSLSVPFPPAPENTAPGAGTGADDSPAEAGVTPSSASASFDSLLPRASPARKAPTDKVSDDAEQAAAALTASLWLPVAPVPATVPVLPTLGAGAAGTGVPPGAGSSPLLGTTISSRAFASFAAALPVLDAAGKVPSTIATAPAPGLSVQPAQPAAASFSSVLMPAAPGPVVPAPVARPLPEKNSPELKTADRSVAPVAGAAIPAVTVTPAPAGKEAPGQTTASLPVGEKNAALDPSLMNDSSAQDNSGKKDFLNAGPAAVNETVSGVGIDVAQVDAAMSAVPPNRSKSAPSAAPALTPAINLPALKDMATTAAPVAPTATVRETMAAVVSAVEAFERRAETGQKSVDLQFRVGDQQLGLHLELRDGTVHTTFRTDSPELRSALAHEWQSVQSGDAREVRLADPVFNSTSTAGGDAAFSSPGQGSPNQREPKLAVPVVSPGASEPVDPIGTEPARTVQSLPLPTQLLHAFA